MKQTIQVSAVVGERPTTAEEAAALCRMIEEARAGQIVLDFAGVHSLGPAFAIEYMERKEICTKIISEINLSFWVQKAVDDAVSELQAPEIHALFL
ncbi:MAG: hypothetical protein ABI361_03350 [Nitrososphaera sp.]|jgi:hypothetical protein